jgi:hypothetical protein
LGLQTKPFFCDRLQTFYSYKKKSEQSKLVLLTYSSSQFKA